jgi:hypothetical protein
MRVEGESGSIRVFDGNGVVCWIEADGWTAPADPPEIDPAVETALVGRTSRLRLPPGRVLRQPDDRQDRSGIGTRKRVSEVGGPIHVESGVTAVLAFEGSATVVERSTGIDVSFADTRSVRLGFHREGSRNDRTITIPGTPEGVATALTHASVAHATASPDRSNPATRRNPPRIERGEAIDVPDEIRSERVETGIELRVPPDLGSLFVLAPLAYYLGARVTVASRDAALLWAPDAGVRRELSSLPRLQADAASLLYRTVALDCLLNRARKESDGRAKRRLAAVGIDPEAIAGAPIEHRLAAYLDAPFREIEQDLPAWHLSVYATPTPEHVTALPYVLDRLAFVYLPDATSLPEKERLQRSLEDFYRTPDDAPTVDPILPDLNRGRLHAWLADGVAIDAFRLLPETYANRRSRPASDDGKTTVTLVINDDEMYPEANAVRRIYRNQSDDPGVELRIERWLDRDALAAALRRPTDLFHYIGHCDRSGFRCVDGHLDAENVDHSGARVFFLNACGSYHQGVSLVEAGSVAGAVTLRPVLDGQAKRVGTAFARLLTRGFAIERALRIASRRTIMNKDYAVVGDGTYALNGSESSNRAVARVSRTGERFRVRVEHGSADSTTTYRSSLLGEGVCLSGSERSTSMSRAELCSFLQESIVPTVYGGRYYWAPDLRRVLLDRVEGETEQ